MSTSAQQIAWIIELNGTSTSPQEAYIILERIRDWLKRTGDQHREITYEIIVDYLSP